MSTIPAASAVRSRRAGDRRSELGVVIEGEAVVVARSPETPRAPRTAASSTSTPRWGAALRAANTNTKRAAPPSKGRSLGIWASLGLQTGAALAGLAVLCLVVFPSGGTKAPSLPAIAMTALAGATR